MGQPLPPTRELKRPGQAISAFDRVEVSNTEDLEHLGLEGAAPVHELVQLVRQRRTETDLFQDRKASRGVINWNDRSGSNTFALTRSCAMTASMVAASAQSASCRRTRAGPRSSGTWAAMTKSPSTPGSGARLTATQHLCGRGFRSREQRRQDKSARTRAPSRICEPCYRSPRRRSPFGSS
jgi:hypothetical protein